MRYLLDTHVAFWLFEGNGKLSRTAQGIITDVKNEVYVSIVSVWEVAIKVSPDKLDFEGGSDAFLSAIKDNNIGLLGLTGEYVKSVEKLPFIHRDPFDRMIISSAAAEGMVIITIDDNIKKYGVQCVW